MSWSEPIVVDELEHAYWIRVAPPTLDAEASQSIRAACLRGLERGVPHIVVDLTDVAEVCVDSIDVLEAAAEELLAKRGVLWLATNRDDGLELCPVPAEGLTELVGLSVALDCALADDISRTAVRCTGSSA